MLSALSILRQLLSHSFCNRTQTSLAEPFPVYPRVTNHAGNPVSRDHDKCPIGKLFVATLAYESSGRLPPQDLCQLTTRPQTAGPPQNEDTAPLCVYKNYGW